MGLPTHSRREVLVSLGNSAPGDGGIFEFSSQVVQRFAAAAQSWRDVYGVGFTIHLREELVGRFGPEVGYRSVTHWQRLRHVQPLRYSLWHSLHQLNKTLPPAGCGPRVVTVHDLNFLYGRNAFSTWRHRRRTRALLARTDHLVAVSQHTADDVRRHFGWRGPLEVIHNGARDLSHDAQQPLPGRENSPRPFLFHLSRMSPSKNPQAILGLATVWPEMDFVLCGPPSDDAKALRARPQPPNVAFHLGISDAQKAWAYAHCAGFVFPSLTEGFGLPPIEAMHFGKPVFLSRLTCLPEIGGEAAYYFDDFDPASMRRVVETGLAAHARPGAAQSVRAHAARFDWDVAAAAYLALYRRLLGLPPA
jgi:glycosyltransferase involved in cell wall biosynthesis